MTEWLRQVIDAAVQFTGQHPSLAGLMLMAFAAAEAVIVVGALVPGEALVLGIAAAAGAGGVDPWHMLLWVAVGAMLGDGVSFWLGRRHGEAISGWPIVRSHPQLLARAEDFIRRHGTKAVVIGRFLPGLRAIMPVAAGVLGMPVTGFALANALSAFVWAAVHVFPAAMLGRLYDQLGAVSGRITVLLALLLVVLFLFIWLARAVLMWGAPRLAAVERWLAARLAARPGRVSQWLARLLAPQRGMLAALLIWGAVLAAAVAGFVGVLEDLLTGDPLVRADTAIHRFLQDLRSEPVDSVMVAITSFGDGPVLLATAMALVGVLLLCRAWRLATGAAAIVGLATLLVPFLKALLHKPRPIAIFQGAGAFSFPSGHTTMTTVVFGIVALLAARRLSFGWKLPLFGFYALWVGLIGFSRIYLAAHWPSDVLGGIFIGLALTAAFALWLELSESRSRASLAASLLAPVAAIAAFVLLGGARLYVVFERNMAIYAPRREVRTGALSTWLHGGWRELPLRRIDLGGEYEEPLVVQWWSTPEAVNAVLARHGWRPARPPAPRDALALFVPDARLRDLPPLPLLHEGRFPALMFVRDGSDVADAEDRLVLRLWWSGLRLNENGADRPLFLGSVTREKVKRLGSFGTALRDRPAPAPDLVLATALAGDPALLVTRPTPRWPLLIRSRTRQPAEKRR